MFYSHQSSTIQNDLSYILTDQIFTGQYWDEFALGALTLPQAPKILLLGLGYGAALRPLLAVRPNSKIVTVEINEPLAQQAKRFYECHFPLLNFEPVVQDAFTYLSENKEHFDLIVIDLYNSESHLKKTISADFVQSTYRALSSKGLIFVNVYGLPNHLVPFVKNNVIPAYKSAFSIFPFQCEIPYRRNLSLLLCKAIQPEVHSHSTLSLKLQDRLGVQIQMLRLQNAKWTESRFDDSRNIQDQDLMFKHIDSDMLEGWYSLLKNLNFYIDELDKLSKPIDLINFFLGPQAPLVFHKMIATNDPNIILFPIFLAGEANNRDLPVDWFLDYFFDRYEDFLRLNSLSFWNYFLPQVFAIVINPKFRNRRYFFMLNSIVQSLESYVR